MRKPGGDDDGDVRVVSDEGLDSDDPLANRVGSVRGGERL
jgi:hypothetical protein